MKKIRLTLYITGQTNRSRNALIQIRKLFERDQHELVIVDVLEQPQAAEKAKVIATPTLIKEIPLPCRRIVGDLCDREKILAGLEIIELEETEKGE